MGSIFLFLALVGIAVTLAGVGYSAKPEHGFLKVLCYIGAVGCVTGAIAVAIVAPTYEREIESLKQEVARLQSTTPVASPTVAAALLYETPQAVPSTRAAAPSPTSEDKDSFHPYDPFVTPRYLAGLFKGRTDAQGQSLVKQYIGLMIGASGKISDISEMDTPVRPEMSVTFQRTSSEPVVLMVFGQKWFDQLKALHSGDKIEVMGVLQKARWNSVILVQCQIVSVGNTGTTK